MIHLIENEKNKEMLIYYPQFQELFKVNKVSAAILKEYVNENIPVDILANKYNTSVEKLKEFIKKFEMRLEEVKEKIEAEKEMRKWRSDVEIKVNVAHKCNMRCIYCYAGEGTYGKPGIMRPEIATDIVPYFDYKFKNSVIDFTFFGGEPFLNLSAIESLCEYATNFVSLNNNTFHFAAITNGTILNKKVLKLVKKFKILLTISIDGPKPIHDALRKFSDGSGSFNKIFNNIKNLKKEINAPLFYESTYTSLHEKEGISRKDLKTYLEDEIGFKGGVISDVAISSKESGFLRPHSSDVESALIALENGDVFVNWVYFPIHLFAHKVRMQYYCNIGKDSFTVTPSGDIYPCQRLVGDKKFKMGNIKSPKEKGKWCEVEKMLNILDKNQNERCQKCWAKFLCKGCPVDLYRATGKWEIPETICERQRNQLEQLLCKLAEIKSDPEKYKKFVAKLKVKHGQIKAV